MAGNDLVQSLLRGLEILELVGGAEGGLSQADLAALLDVKQPTVANLTRTLLHKGYLRKQSRPVRYRLGRALQDLVEREQSRNLLRLAAEEIRAMSREVEEVTIVYTEAFGGDLLPRLRLSSEAPLYLERRPRAPLSPYSSASGLAMQAFMMPDDRQLFRQRFPLSEHNTGRWESQAQLDAFLETVREQGYIDLGRGRNTAIAAPIYDVNQRLFAVLGMSCNRCSPCPPARQAAIREPVLAATGRLSTSWEGQSAESTGENA